MILKPNDANPVAPQGDAPHPHSPTAAVPTASTAQAQQDTAPMAPLVIVFPVSDRGPAAPASLCGDSCSQGMTLSSEPPSAVSTTDLQLQARESAANGTTSGDPSWTPAQDSGPKQLIVNYIAPQVTEVELRALFEQFGPVQSARIIYDKHTGGTKGYGFIYYVWSDHAAKAIKFLQGFELYGKYLRVGYAVPQRPCPTPNTSITSAGSSLGSSRGNSFNDGSAGSGGSATTQSDQLAALAAGFDGLLRRNVGLPNAQP